MTRRTFWQIALAAASTGAAARSATERLFDGRDFKGWRRAGNGLWTIEDGCIVARFDRANPGPGYLFTAGEYGDFDLRLEFWISKSGNSGVYVRQPWRHFGTIGDARPAHSPGDGVEVQIDYNDPKNMTGAIYNLKQPSAIRGGEERWVRYRIACTGPRVDVWIDVSRSTAMTGSSLRAAPSGFKCTGRSRTITS